MNCPVCQTTYLEFIELDSNLRTLTCGQCGGHWVQSFQYWHWLKDHGPNLPELPDAGKAAAPGSDSKAGKLCPECGRILMCYKVGHGLTFHLDRCGTCGGLWFDKDEWETLKRRNLHDDVHFVFSAAWQRQLADEERRQAEAQRLETLLGAKDYAELQRVRAWVQAHPRKRAILAALSHGDR